jgi:hypothetical protein
MQGSLLALNAAAPAFTNFMFHRPSQGRAGHLFTCRIIRCHSSFHLALVARIVRLCHDKLPPSCIPALPFYITPTFFRVTKHLPFHAACFYCVRLPGGRIKVVQHRLGSNFFGNTLAGFLTFRRCTKCTYELSTCFHHRQIADIGGETLIVLYCICWWREGCPKAKQRRCPGVFNVRATRELSMSEGRLYLPPL